MESVNWPKPGYTSITCSTISNIPYNLAFTTKLNDFSIGCLKCSDGVVFVIFHFIIGLRGWVRVYGV